MVGKRLRLLRTNRDITQKELGKMLGVGKATISQYESETRKPDTDMLRRIADYFGTSIDYLVGRTDYPRMAAAGEIQGYYLTVPGKDDRLRNILEDPRILDLLLYVPDLNEEEKELLTEHWQIVLCAIKKKCIQCRKNGEPRQRENICLVKV